MTAQFISNHLKTTAACPDHLPGQRRSKFSGFRADIELRVVSKRNTARGSIAIDALLEAAHAVRLAELAALRCGWCLERGAGVQDNRRC